MEIIDRIPVALTLGESYPLYPIGTKHNPVSKPSILIIESCQEMQAHFKQFLESDYQLCMVENTIEALQKIGSETFEMIIYDIEFEQESDAVAFLRQIRSNQIFAVIPVIAITGYSLPEGKAIMQRARFDAYLPKPFTLRSMREVLGRCLVRRRFMVLGEI